MLVAITNQILGILTIAGQIIIVAIIILLLTKKLPAFLSKKALFFAFIVALAATAGSLTYSDIIGFEPCKLCWFQRILMYPQALILGMALIKKDKNIVSYSLALSAAGAFIAAYHYLLQVGVAPSVVCSTVGYSVSCAKKFVMQFGYITIPMMSLTAFLLINLLMVVAKRFNK